MATLGLGVFFGGVITGVPVVTGVAEGVSHQKKANEEAADNTRMIKFGIEIQCLDHVIHNIEPDPTRNPDIVVLKDNKLWVIRAPDRASYHEPAPLLDDDSTAHTFSGFFIMYPDDNRSPAERGLVSTISLNPPMLNWIYVDEGTHELRYGNRTQSIEHTVGEWDWSEPLVSLSDNVAAAVAERAQAEEEGAGRDVDEPLRYLTLRESDTFYATAEPGPTRSDGLIWSLGVQRNDKQIQRPCKLVRRPLPGEVRKMQEAEAEDKMRVKQSGDLKTTLNLREG